MSKRCLIMINWLKLDINILDDSKIKILKKISGR